MVVGVLQLDLIVHGAQSLKEKRSALRRILGRCRERFPVSCAEVGDQDLWQSSRLGYSMVAVDEAAIDRVFQKIEEFVENMGLAEVSGSHVEFLHY